MQINNNETDPQEEVKKEKTIKKAQVQDLDFNGEYSDSGETDDENEIEDEDQEINNEQENSKKQKTGNLKKKVKKQAKKQNKQQQKKQQLICNISDCRYPVVKFVAKKIFKWKLQYDIEATDWDITWTDNAVQPEQLGRMQPHQRINHFPGMFSLSRKNHLARNLTKMKRQYPEVYKFFPQTWLLPAEYNDFKCQFEKKQKGKAKTFIVKPEASCQGQGIFLTRCLEDLNPSDHYVVQRYLHKPFLIDDLKFDFRVYVLLAGCDPLRIYIYEEGLTRFATEVYQLPQKDNLDNLCMHLTNYAINKDNPNFEFNENENVMDKGHKRSLTSVLKLLQSMGHDVKDLWTKVKKMIILAIISAQPILSHHYRSCQPDNYANNMCFEILGLDVIIDQNLKPYLLEVNYTPSFTTDTPLDSFIKKNVIRDTLILMNVNLKSRNEVMNQRRELMQQRVLTGKKVKLLPEEKKEQQRIAQEKRDEWENNNHGRFEKIYPNNNELEMQEFQEYLNYSLQNYEESTGANIRRNTKKVDTSKQLIMEPKKQNKPQDLEKIYNQKMAKPLLPPKKSILNQGQTLPKQINQSLNENEIEQQKILQSGDDSKYCEFEDQDTKATGISIQRQAVSKEQTSPNSLSRNHSSRQQHEFRIKKNGQISPYQFRQINNQQNQQEQYEEEKQNNLQCQEIEDQNNNALSNNYNLSEQPFQINQNINNFESNNQKPFKQQNQQQILYQQQVQIQQQINSYKTSQKQQNSKYNKYDDIDNNQQFKKYQNSGSINLQKKHGHQAESGDHNGLFVTPKLFDLNGLTKANDDINIKNQQQSKQKGDKGQNSNVINYAIGHFELNNLQRQQNQYK